MAEDAGRSDDLGRCQHCGDRVSATHMLTKTYPVDERGRWQRRLDDFAEDVVVVCTGCGEEPEGRYEAHDGTFAFVPVNCDTQETRGG